MSATVKSFFDPDTCTWSYVVADASSRHCAIIDPVLDFDPASGKLSSRSANQIEDYVRQQDLTVDWLLETHVHADHLTASEYLRSKLGGRIGIGNRVGEVQAIFGSVFHAGPDFRTDGSQFDQLFADNETFRVGDLTFRVMHTPGHTPACVTYVTEDLPGGAAFIGDTLFMPDYGTARTDFPGGDAGTLFDSIQRILALPGTTTLYMCHDYLPEGRTVYQDRTTVNDERQANIHLASVDRLQFVAARESRDSKLAAPRLLLPAIQVNMCAGALPVPEDNGIRYLRIPLKVTLQ